MVKLGKSIDAFPETARVHRGSIQELAMCSDGTGGGRAK
jgi:hypothetical protein